MRSYTCRCGYQPRKDTEDQLLAKVRSHMKKAHPDLHLSDEEVQEQLSWKGADCQCGHFMYGRDMDEVTRLVREHIRDAHPGMLVPEEAEVHKSIAKGYGMYGARTTFLLYPANANDATQDQDGKGAGLPER